MTAPSPDSSELAGLRVLVVDNDPEIRNLHARLLTTWSCIPIVAEGYGEELDDSARRLAHEKRCQLALVDMRLREDNDPRDRSGLELVRQLHPTEVLIVSGRGDWEAAADSIKRYGARDFVGKEAGAKRLYEQLVAVARELGIGAFRVSISWPPQVSAGTIRTSLFSEESIDVPSDELEEIIGRLLYQPDSMALQQVMMEFISTPLEPTSPVITALRESAIFRATLKGQLAPRMVKIGGIQKIKDEIENYNKYVRFGLKDVFRPTMENAVILWGLGAIAYTYVGGHSFGARDGVQTFSEYYQSADEDQQALLPIVTILDSSSWGNFYSSTIPLQSSLFEAYDLMWQKRLSASFSDWKKQPANLFFDLLGAELPNPTNWLTKNYQLSNSVVDPQSAVTHGDLHGDNIIVYKDEGMLIDYEQSGPGPALRDIVSLSCDIITRLTPLSQSDESLVYDLAVSLCEPVTPETKMQVTQSILSHAEASKAFSVLRRLQEQARKRIGYSDQREFLWGMLLYSIFLTTVSKADPLRTRKCLLIASVICGRLDRWNLSDRWPLEGWPQVRWFRDEEMREARVVVQDLRRRQQVLKALLQVSQDHGQGRNDILRELEDVKTRLAAIDEP